MKIGESILAWPINFMAAILWRASGSINLLMRKKFTKVLREAYHGFTIHTNTEHRYYLMSCVPFVNVARSVSSMTHRTIRAWFYFNDNWQSAMDYYPSDFEKMLYDMAKELNRRYPRNIKKDPRFIQTMSKIK